MAETFNQSVEKANTETVKIRNQEVKLPINLSSQQKSEVINALKNNTPILICGKQGPTGKTTLKEMLVCQGYVAFEEWECIKITL